MGNLLEKASIVTTPTAYENGKILSVKPAPSLSSELVVNGDFATDLSDWLVTDGAAGIEITWTANGVSFITDGAGGGIQQSVMTVGKSYLIEFDYTAVSGAIKMLPYFTDISETKRYSGYFVATTANIAFYRKVGGTEGIIDNVSVKEAIDGDFDFTRNSSATRVNSQGLIEDVQILSSNLVSNGDFSQEGSELITNGGFATDSDWNLRSSWVISNGNCSLTPPNSDYLSQASVLTLNKSYKLTFDVVVNSGNLQPQFFDGGFQTIGTYNTTQTVEVYFKPTSSGTLYFKPNLFDGSIDNVSVKEVGQDWTLGTGWSIGANKLVGSNADASTYQGVGIQVNKSYKIQFTVIDYVSGSVRPLLNGLPNVDGTNVNSNGTYTQYLQSNSGSNGNFTIRGVFFNGSITNISVIEITDDTNLPRINYEGFSYQDSLGSELVTNGDFSNGSTGWTIINGTVTDKYNASMTAYQSGIRIAPFSNTGTFKVVFDLVVTSGSCKFDAGGSNNAIYSTSGTKEIIVTNTTKFEFNAFNLGWVGTLDNVSVKEYLGQEVVPDSGRGSWLFERQSTNLIPYSEDFSTYSAFTGASIQQNYSTSPDGLQNATKLNFSANSFSRIEQVISGSFASQTHTVSLWARCASNTEAFRLKCTNRGYVDYYSENKTATTQWQKFSFSATFGSTSGDIGAAIANSTDAQERSIEIFGFQVEANKSFSTSYVPTNGSTVTRLQDAAFGAGSSDLINSTEGVLYAEIAKFQDDNDNIFLLSLNNSSDNSDHNTVTIGFDSDDDFFIRVKANNTNAFVSNNQTSSKDVYYKVALSYKSGDSKIYINGNSITPNSGSLTNAFSFGSTLDNLSFDYNGNGVLPFFGKAKCVAVFKEALTDEELECLTTI